MVRSQWPHYRNHAYRDRSVRFLPHLTHLIHPLYSQSNRRRNRPAARSPRRNPRSICQLSPSHHITLPFLPPASDTHPLAIHLGFGFSNHLYSCYARRSPHS